jgi:hypothetical protein
MPTPSPEITGDFTEVALYIKALLEEDPRHSLHFEDVFYGDQALIARFPTACVETGPVEWTLSGAPYRFDVDIRIFVMVYFGNVQDNQLTRLKCDQLSEEIRHTLMDDKQMGNHVVHGWVASLEPGFAIRGGALTRSARVTWVGLSKINA